MPPCFPNAFPVFSSAFLLLFNLQFLVNFPLTHPKQPKLPENLSLAAAVVFCCAKMHLRALFTYAIRESLTKKKMELEEGECIRLTNLFGQ